jgi:hypothetical protein
LLLEFAGLGEKEAVTPLGRPVIASWTFPLNPFWGSIYRKYDVAEVPRPTLISAGVSIVKLGTTTVSVAVVDAVRGPDVPVIVMVYSPGIAEFVACKVSSLK